MTDEPEFNPHTPGPPREVHEDAAARERMTDPEETASQIVMPLIKLLGERNRGRRSMAVMREDTTTLNRAANAIADELREAHAAGKAEGAAEEREACTQIVSDRAEHYQWSPNTDRFLAVQGIAQAIRQRSEAPNVDREKMKEGV